MRFKHNKLLSSLTRQRYPHYLDLELIEGVSDILLKYRPQESNAANLHQSVLERAVHHLQITLSKKAKPKRSCGMPQFVPELAIQSKIPLRGGGYTSMMVKNLKFQN